MLELRPSCEHCNTALPPHATNAVICSFECTYCTDCAELFNGVCPNCGGGFERRPVRPVKDRKGGNFLGNYPAGDRVVFKPKDLEAHRELVNAVGSIPAHLR